MTALNTSTKKDKIVKILLIIDIPPIPPRGELWVKLKIVNLFFEIRSNKNPVHDRCTSMQGHGG